ncbi:type II toxin-antitoxin system death-on-curing family toxin [Bacillus cereus]|uniref:Type II toxin-antitoxin system death-on-curing family toxin n=1 Tax=Bacillus thuringiensis TaxID=1428 RepID=A0AB36VGF2_BACTU|nr:MULTISPECIES: type II toxin-antitoxin system death-on-curing family toxin [Bacillus cereus group]PDZ55656.1 type II toxin-antitoxin system death-on-curing family toxin [Bacillus cereus]PFC28435.1 type II toxin-antitoxin system death-on-curing family toxin [Bacillus thuringiensis]PFO26268.1 type II toxin-antitoxin system death-on-curing family toxin [Bacillus thuringiensis]PFS40276.1 type II toxin-antitoxin system death-on-curing family toxin [Bacillus thuringiensis]PFS58267.1 type II toxin-
MNAVKYLTATEVILLNELAIKKITPSEPVGVKDLGLLESAVDRPKSSAFGDDAYPTIFEKAAALFESIGKNHAFLNANKRTAFIALNLFLGYNGYKLEMTQQFAEDFTVDMVNKKYDFEQIVAIIKEYSVER